jgi:RNA-directed DNA polymerase
MWGLRKLGLLEWMVRQLTGFEDHYQAVAKTKGLSLINKEILTKRGLQPVDKRQFEKECRF